MFSKIDNFLYCNSIAVVGASNNPSKWGYEVMDFLHRGKYNGKIYPVNKSESEVWGLESYPSLLKIHDNVDIVDICIPAKYTPEIVKEAVAIKAKGVVIFSAGFREAGEKDLEDKIKEIIKGTDTRVLGPNVQGVICPDNHLCNNSEPLITLSGNVGIISQSGSVSATIAEWCERDNIGISAMINLGNQIDICETDVLDYFLEDAKTDVIAYYFEGTSHSNDFNHLLKNKALKKPILIIKPGRTNMGKRSAISHTGSIAGNDKIFSDVCRQYGLINCSNLTHFYDSLTIFSCVKNIGRGNRAIVLSTSGGVGSIAVDELVENDLHPVILKNESIEKIRNSTNSGGTNVGIVLDLMVPISSWIKPVKLLNQEMEDEFDIYFFVIADSLPGIEDLIEELKSKTKKPIIISYTSGSAAERAGRKKLQQLSIPVYSTPDRAARALRDLVGFAERRKSYVTIK